MPSSPTDTRAPHNAKLNRKARKLLARVVGEYLQGRSAISCMDELVKAAQDFADPKEKIE